MSFETWLEEFYPISAHQLVGEKNYNDNDLLEHSINKWEGLLKENLEKHGVVYWRNFNTVTDKEPSGLGITINSESCALCIVYSNTDAKASCGECPLAISYGRPCDNGRSSPYRLFRTTKDPKPMVDALKKALKEL